MEKAKKKTDLQSEIRRLNKVNTELNQELVEARERIQELSFDRDKLGEETQEKSKEMHEMAMELQRLRLTIVELSKVEHLRKYQDSQSKQKGE
jgi:uncharacterized coiled-coil DUF342 family protein